MRKLRRCLDECPNGLGGDQRRQLPALDPGADEPADPAWMRTSRWMPKEPGWYWVGRKGVWPQIVEAVHVNGKIVFDDQHSRSAGGKFWTRFAGPIPIPFAMFEDGHVYRNQ